MTLWSRREKKEGSYLTITFCTGLVKGGYYRGRKVRTRKSFVKKERGLKSTKRGGEGMVTLLG